MKYILNFEDAISTGFNYLNQYQKSTSYVVFVKS